MFAPKMLAMLLVWTTLSCHALLVPAQVKREASELYSPTTLYARNELDDRAVLTAHELAGIKYAEEGNLDMFHQNALEAAMMSRDPDIIAMAKGPGSIVKRGIGACVSRRRWTISARTAISCWDNTYRAPRRDPHYHVIRTAKSILIQINSGHRAVAIAAAKTLVKKARELDEAATKAWELEAATKARLARDVTTGAELEHYAAVAVVPRSPAPGDLTLADVSDADLDFFGIHWDFLHSIGAFISKCIITTLTRNAPRLLRPRLIVLRA